MPRVRIPRTATSRRERTYAILIKRVYPRRTFAAFDGPALRCGAAINVQDLWPSADFPAIPLLLEYAGNDRSGRGHRRSNDIVLWRYEQARGAFIEVARSISQGNEWIDHLRPIVQREIGLQEVRDAFIAEKVTGRVLAVLDAELELLGQDDRGLVMTFVYEQFTARATGAWAHQ